jgi:hypothetical protein
MEGASPKPLKVEDLKERILNPALTSTYVVNIQPPDTDAIKDKMQAYGIVNSSPNRYDLLTIPCSEASIPGSTLATNEIIDDYTGITERHAYRRLYDDRISLTFYVESFQYYVIKFFEAWMSVVANEQLENFSNPVYNYRVSFPKSYYADAFTLTKFERNFGSGLGSPEPTATTLKYDFIQAFPIAIDSIPLSYDSSQLLKCTVSFSYSRYKISNGIEKKPKSTNSNAPAIPELSSAQILGGAETGQNTYNYELGAVPGQFNVPAGQGGSADLLGGLGGIGVRNPAQQ